MSTIPKYLNHKNNVIKMILGTALFAELFILIFRPFGSGDWVNILGDNDYHLSDDFMYFAFATLAVLVAMGVIAISRSVVYRIAKKREIMVWECVLIIAVEIVAMALIYTLFALYILRIEGTFFEGWKQAILYTLCILLIPYSGFMLLFYSQDKAKQLRQLREGLSAVENTTGENVVHFYDEKGEQKISLRANTIYYIEAADNYISIHYISGKNMQQYMLRNSLKVIEEQYESIGLIRCHRSYMVNINKIKVLSRGKDGLEIDFGDERIKSIPITKTYSKKLLEKFSE